MLQSAWSRAWPPCHIAAQAGCAMHAADVQGGGECRAQLCERAGLGGTRKRPAPRCVALGAVARPDPGARHPAICGQAQGARLARENQEIWVSSLLCLRLLLRPGMLRAGESPGAAGSSSARGRARCSPSKWKVCLFLGYQVSGRKAGNCQGFYWIPVKGI